MKKYLSIIICIIFLIIIVLYGLFLFSTDNIKYEDNNKDIVYDISEYSSNNQNLAYVNLVGEDIKLINDNIKLFVEDYYGLDNVYIGYDYNKTGSILSLLITIIDKNTNTTPVILFTSYFINLKNNTIVSDIDILKMNGYKSNKLKNTINSTFNDFYKNSDINKYCDINCFNSGLSTYYDYDKDVSLYMVNNELRGYISIHENIEYILYSYLEDKDFYIKVGDVDV